MKKFQLPAVLLAFSVIFGVLSCKKENPDPNPDPPTPTNPVVGNWKSVGANISQLISFSTQIDCVHVEFKADNSYRLVWRDTGGVALTFTGSYAATKSNVGNIYNIQLNQTVPDQRVIRGIYEVFPAAPDSMKMEITQVEPEIPNLSPPTAAGGFGTTPGVTAGWNTQRFRRIN